MLKQHFYHEGATFPYNETAERFLDDKEEDGHSTARWAFTLKNPGHTPPDVLARMSIDLNCEVSDLLAAGFGRLNKYDDVMEVAARLERGEYASPASRRAAMA